MISLSEYGNGEQRSGHRQVLSIVSVTPSTPAGANSATPSHLSHPDTPQPQTHALHSTCSSGGTHTSQVVETSQPTVESAAAGLLQNDNQAVTAMDQQDVKDRINLNAVGSKACNQTSTDRQHVQECSTNGNGNALVSSKCAAMRSESEAMNIQPGKTSQCEITCEHDVAWQPMYEEISPGLYRASVLSVNHACMLSEQPLRSASNLPASSTEASEKVSGVPEAGACSSTQKYSGGVQDIYSARGDWPCTQAQLLLFECLSATEEWRNLQAQLLQERPQHLVDCPPNIDPCNPLQNTPNPKPMDSDSAFTALSASSLTTDAGLVSTSPAQHLNNDLEKAACAGSTCSHDDQKLQKVPEAVESSRTFRNGHTGEKESDGDAVSASPTLEGCTAAQPDVQDPTSTRNSKSETSHVFTHGSEDSKRTTGRDGQQSKGQAACDSVAQQHLHHLHPGGCESKPLSDSDGVCSAEDFVAQVLGALEEAVRVRCCAIERRPGPPSTWCFPPNPPLPPSAELNIFL